MNENEFELDGKVYVAVDAQVNEFGATCNGCAFDLCLCSRFRCSPSQRVDGRDVIFMEKPQ